MKRREEIETMCLALASVGIEKTPLVSAAVEYGLRLIRIKKSGEDSDTERPKENVS